MSVAIQSTHPFLFVVSVGNVAEEECNWKVETLPCTWWYPCETCPTAPYLVHYLAFKKNENYNIIRFIIIEKKYRNLWNNFNIIIS